MDPCPLTNHHRPRCPRSARPQADERSFLSDGGKSIGLEIRLAHSAEYSYLEKRWHRSREDVELTGDVVESLSASV